MRLALFTLLPVLLGATIVIFDRTAIGPVRRAEAFLILLFIVGVGGSGISAFIAHVFLSRPATPFQLAVGFAWLAVGLMGAVAAERRDGFREATVAAATVLGVGASIASGNVLQAISGLATPVLLIGLLLTLRRAERAPPNITLRSWMVPVRYGAVAAVAIAASAAPVGHATGQVMASSLTTIAVAFVAFWWIVSRAPSHRAERISSDR